MLRRFVSSKAFKPAVEFVEALKVYRRLNGDTRVKIRFVSPENDPAWPQHLWSYHLGAHAAELRRLYRLGKLYPSLYQDLVQEDFVFDTREYEFQQIFMPALLKYKELFGNTLVPHYFVVPATSEWPRQCWNVALGRRVNTLRLKRSWEGIQEQVKQLDEIGFVWDALAAEYQVYVLPALRTYKKLNGNLLIPQKFVIPHEEVWPEATRGRQLGKKVNRMRDLKFSLPSELKEALDDIGMVWNVPEYDIEQRIIPAVRLFYQKHGHVKFLKSFQIPATPDWPQHLHGFRLGSIWRDIGHSRKYFKYLELYRDELEQMGYQLGAQPTQRYLRPDDLDILVQALPKYDALHGTKHIRQSFRIPESKDWPSELHDYPLGLRVAQLSKAYSAGELSEDQVTALVQAGFGYRLDRFKYCYYPPIKCFYQKYGHSRVRQDFVVPTDDKDWPELFHGYQLGISVLYLRNRGPEALTPEQVKDLEAVEFIWDASKEFWSNSLLPALKTFASLHPHRHFVPSSFIIPQESPWPKPMWGYHLGRVYDKLRKGMHYRELVKRDREELKQLGL